MNNKFPPFLNNNYEGSEPLAGFDFYLQLNGENVGKFMKCEFSVKNPIYMNCEALMEITIGEGIIDASKVGEALSLDLSYKEEANLKYEGLKSSAFEIMFQAADPDGWCTIGAIRFDSITLGCMPGRRTAVIEMKGLAKTLHFTQSD